MRSGPLRWLIATSKGTIEMLYPSLRPPTSDGRAMPHILDVILVVYLAMRAIAGWMRGAVVGVASLIGLVLGVWAGLWTSGIVADQFFDENWTWLAAGAVRVCITLVIAEIIQGICVHIAQHIHRAFNSVGLGNVDRFGGSVLNVIATALVVTVAATALSPILPPSWTEAIDESSVITQTNRVIPDEVNEAAARLVGRAADTFPKVFADEAPSLPAPAPDDETVTTPGVRRAAQSIVKVRSRAPRCDRASEGTGWVSSRTGWRRTPMSSPGPTRSPCRWADLGLDCKPASSPTTRTWTWRCWRFPTFMPQP